SPADDQGSDLRPAWEGDVLDAVEDNAHRVADLNRGRVDLVDRPIRRLDEVADEPQRRVLVERDHDRVVWRELLVRGQERRVRHDEGPDRAPSRRRVPAELERAATRATRPRRHPAEPGGLARLGGQPGAGAGGPGAG